MQSVKFEPGKDFDRLGRYLRHRYLEIHEAIFWLPERLHDLVCRVCAQETDEGRV